jgi:hypothetical protein
MTTKHLAAALSIFIASAVLLSSLHATHVWGIAALPHNDSGKKIIHDEGGGNAKDSAKIVQELHHHSDKSGSQLIKDVGDHSKIFDTRTQRILRDKKETVKDKLARWQRAWEEFIMMHHLFI